MPVTVTSTTDTPEAVTEAIGDLAQVAEEVVEESVSAEIADETTDESETSEKEDEDQPEGKPKKKGGFKKKIGKLIGKLSQAEQEREYWRDQALRTQKPEPTLEKKADTSGKPKAEDYESHNEYLEAFVDWKAEQKLSARDLKLKETQVKSEQDKIVESYREKLGAFKQTKPDYDEVMEEVDDIPLSFAVKEILLNSDPELAYELAKDRVELDRICKLPAIQAARELGKFEARLVKDPEQKPKTTKAPAPIKPVKSASSGSVKKSIHDPNLSQREYERLREEQIAQRRA